MQPTRALVVLALLMAGSAASAAPVSIGHSGYLLDASDAPLQATVSMQFRIYRQATGVEAGEVPWSSGACSVGVAKGYYAVTLGASCGSGLTSAELPPGETRYLEVDVGGVTLTPRTKLLSAPGAVESADTKALVSRLATPGTLNDPANPVHWTKLAGVPGALADGDADTTYTAGTGLVLGAGNAFALAPGGVDANLLAADAASLSKVSGSALALSGGTLTSTASISLAAGATYSGKGSGLTELDGANVSATGGRIPAAAMPLAVTFDTLTMSAAAGAGALKLGKPTSCTAADYGTIRWSGTAFEGCTSAGWSALGAGAAAAAPTLSAVNPATGPTRGAFTITLTGTGFTAPVNVFVGGTVATSVSLVSANTITATVPALATAGAKDVMVQNANAATATLPSSLTLVASGESQALAGTSCRTINAAFPASLPSATYWIDPNGGGTADALEVWCDMSTADGGGWTLAAQNRVDAHPTSFRGSWDAYKVGFGNVKINTASVGWIGNEQLYQLTKAGNTTLKVITSARTYRYANWSVSSEATDYTLNVPNSDRNVANANAGLRYANGMKFSTYDRDNDPYSGNCANDRSSGWWYNQCWYTQWGDSTASQTYWNEADVAADNYTTIELWVK